MSAELKQQRTLRYICRSLGYAKRVRYALILDKYDMTGGGVSEAMKIMAGMSAACLGMGNVASNYANQVSAPHRNTIFEFIKND